MKISFYLSFFLAVASCDYRKVKEQRSSQRPQGNFSVQSLNFASVQATVFAEHCIDCHGTKGGVNLESYEETIKHLPSIRSEVLSRQMPPKTRSRLSDEQIGLIVAWIDAGAPEFSSSLPTENPLPPAEEAPPAQPPSPPVVTPAPPPTEVLQPTFRSLKKFIFEPKCIQCHSEGNRADHFPLTTREETISRAAGIVNFEKPEDSSLVTTVVDQSMPPKRSGLAPLTQEEINVLIEWIRRGAPEGENE